MSLTIRTKQTPFRVSLNRKEPTELFVSIQNPGPDTEMASLILETGGGLGLDATGLHQSHQYRMNEIAPGKTKELYIKLFAKPNADYGENPFRLTLIEHFGNWNLVKKKTVLDESVLVQR